MTPEDGLGKALMANMHESTGHAEGAAGTPHQGVGHVLPVKLLVAVFGGLVILTILTVAVSEMNLGPWSLYAALAVALVKATLVALYFMHLRYDKPFNAVVFLGCLIFATLFISFALTDSLYYKSTKISIPTDHMHTPFGDTK